MGKKGNNKQRESTKRQKRGALVSHVKFEHEEQQQQQHEEQQQQEHEKQQQQQQPPQQQQQPKQEQQQQTQQQPQQQQQQPKQEHQQGQVDAHMLQCPSCEIHLLAIKDWANKYAALQCIIDRQQVEITELHRLRHRPHQVEIQEDARGRRGRGRRPGRGRGRSASAGARDRDRNDKNNMKNAVINALRTIAPTTMWPVPSQPLPYGPYFSTAMPTAFAPPYTPQYWRPY